MFPFCVIFRNCLVLCPSLTFPPNSRCMKQCILFGGWKHVITRTVNILTSPKLVEGKACWKNSRTPINFWGKPMVSTDKCIKIILVFIRCYKTYCGGLFWSFVAYFIILPPFEKGCPDGWQAPQKRYTMGRSTTVQTRDRTTPCWVSTSQNRSGSLSRAVDPWLGWDMGSCATYMGF